MINTNLTNGCFGLDEIKKIIKKNNFIEIRFVNDKRKLYVCHLHAFQTINGIAKNVGDLKNGDKIWIDISAFTSDKSLI